MKAIALLVAAALGGLAVWRRRSLRADIDKVASAAKSVPSKVKVRVGSRETDDAGADADTDADTAESGAAESSETPSVTVAAGTA